MYTVESNVEIPVRTNDGATKYPFGTMAVGESFAAPASEADRVRQAAVKWRARHAGWSYKTRIGGDQIRIWRTA